MLQAHLSAVEDSILSLARIQDNSGHNLHKGTPREIFVREFLENHLPSTLTFGTGELIDCHSRPGERRNQHDIVIFDKNYPKIHYGAGISGFLIESVTATIEVKSKLDKNALEKAVLAAVAAKQLQVHRIEPAPIAYRPPSVLNYVIAYDGPANMDVIGQWLADIHDQHELAWFTDEIVERDQREIPSPSLDGIFILGKGFITFDNNPASLVADDPKNKMRFVGSETTRNNLYVFFTQFLAACSGYSGSMLDIQAYLEHQREPIFTGQVLIIDLVKLNQRNIN